MRRLTILVIAVASMAVASTARAALLLPHRASDAVTLTTSGAPCDAQGFLVDVRQTSDGMSEPFSIPVGKVLIITGASISAYELCSSCQTYVGLARENSGAVSFQSLALHHGVTDLVGNFSHELNFGTGVVIKPPAHLCVDAGSADAFVWGFLAPDR